MYTRHILKLAVSLTAILSIFSGVIVRSQTMSNTKNLYTNKFSNYDTRIRPRDDQNITVDVASRFIPTNIIEFETTEQRFTVLGYLELSWMDEVVTWADSMDSYGGIESIKVPITDIWTPSMILGKAFGGNGVIGDSNSDTATVRYDGLVQWSPEGTFSFVCEVDIKFYPFDEQTCTLTYYVSDESIFSVNLNHNTSVNLDKFLQNSEWDLVEISKDIEFKYTAHFVNINFRVQRRASFTTYTIITPLLMLAFLNVCVFLVPIDSGEKGSFAITIFLSYGIFVTIVSDTLPHNSLQISYFVLFLIVLLLLSVLSVFYTIMQAKVFATYGENPCSFKCFGCLRRTPKKTEPQKNDNQLFVVRTQGENLDLEDVDADEKDDIDSKKHMEDSKEEENPRTWKSFLEKLDTCIFVGFFAMVTLATMIFFALMMQRFGASSITKD